MVCEVSARSAFELLGYPSASISRAFVNVDPSCFQVRLACPFPALSNRHFLELVHLVVLLHLKLTGFLDLRVQRLSSVIVPCLIEQVHRLTLQEEQCSLGRRSSPADSSRPHWTEGTCAVCSTCAATVFRKKYPHASLRHS